MLPFDRLLVPDMSTARIVAPPLKKARGVVVAPAPAPPPKKACGVVVAPAPKRVTGVVVPSPQRASAALVGLVGKVKAFYPCPPPKPPSIKPRVIRCSSSSSPKPPPMSPTVRARSRSPPPKPQGMKPTVRARSRSPPPKQPPMKPREPDHPPMKEAFVYSASWWSSSWDYRRATWDGKTTVYADFRRVTNPQHNVALRGHIGWNGDILVELLRVDKFRDMLARIVSLAWSHRIVHIVMYCRAGKHRSVAAACLMQNLLLMINPNMSVVTEHLEKNTWGGSTCEGQCDECMLKKNADEIQDWTRDVLNMLPYEQELPEVWLG